MATISEKMTAIANAIRTKTGGTGTLNLDGMANALNNIPERGTNDLTASGATVTVPAGNYKSSTSKSVAIATQATPSVSIDSAGKITASATQTAGYVTAGTKTGTKQMTVKAAQTITPGTSNKTIASGTYLTGTQTIKGDSNLKAENIKKGISIFDVTGTAEIMPDPSILYDNGDQCVTVSGGWTCVSNGGIRGYFNSTNLQLKIVNSTDRDATFYSINSIDLSKYSTLKASVNVTSAGKFHMGITSHRSNYGPQWQGGYYTYTTANSTGSRTMSLNISSVSSGYIAFHADVAAAYIYKVWLE